MARKLTIADKDITTLNVNAPKPGFITAFTGAPVNIAVDKISTAEPFVSLFPIKEEVLSSITESMKTKGYDKTQPIIMWKEENILIDGHTRLTAAKSSGLDTIPVLYASFASEDDVIDYMHRLQFYRRNITDADLIKLIMNALPQYEKKYGEGSKAEFLTKRFIGLSEGKAKQAVIVVEKASEDDIEKIKSDHSTIRQIYYKLKEDKNSPQQKVTSNFFDFEDDGNKQIVRTEDNGTFYFRNYEKKKEVKAFVLPKFLNSPNLRKRIGEVIEDELKK